MHNIQRNLQHQLTWSVVIVITIYAFFPSEFNLDKQDICKLRRFADVCAHMQWGSAPFKRCFGPKISIQIWWPIQISNKLQSPWSILEGLEKRMRWLSVSF